MINTVGDILEVIKAATGKNEQEIADDILYTRSHLNTLKKKPATGSEVAGLLIKTYRINIEHFVSSVTNWVSANSDGLSQGPLQGPVTQSVGHEAILKAIERLEQKFDRAFSEESDSSIEREIGKKVQKDKQAKTGK